MTTPILKTLLAGTFCLGASSALAAPIDFETIPGDTPVEGLQITNQFASTAGVTFSLVDGGTGETVDGGPVLADVGGNRTAFIGAGNVGDGIAAQDVDKIGTFFLTDDGQTTGGLRNPILVATYSVASSFISADILDIDSNETFTIRFYDSVIGGTLLNTINLTTSSPDTGNGRATPVSYDHGSAEILRVEFEGFIGGSFFGLGFDNFDSGVTIAPPVPLPASLGFLLTGLTGFAGHRALRKRT